MSSENYREIITIYLKGLAMGAADAIPGVSGGTIALITGIYERLILSITSVNLDKGIEAFNATKRLETDILVDIFHEIDGVFLLALGSGIFTAVIAVLHLIHFLLQKMPVPTFGFFFGLIAVSAAILYTGISLSTPRRKLSSLLGFLTAFLGSGLAIGAIGHGPLVVFIAGAVAVSAMVLPGISGSLLLIILGQYEYMTREITSFTEALMNAVQTWSIAGLFQEGKTLLLFASGAVIGLFSVAHVVRYALENHRQLTMAFLVSLVAGALRAPVLEVEKILVERGVSWIQIIPEFAASALLGGLTIYLIDRKAGIVEY